MGFLTPDRGMVVHRSDCQMLRRNRDNTHSLIEVNWLQIQPEFYRAQITLVAYDRAGLLRDVAAVVADAGVNMTSVTSTSNPASQKAVITATLEIASKSGVLDQIERILYRLRQVKSVVDVVRATCKQG
jgi:GTP pyrophosphokinase